jgi:hypothetical protein
MIKYNEWGKHLRLGNWLFLYTGLSSISKQSNNGLIFPAHFMWDYFENPPFTTENKEFDELFHFKSLPYSEELKKEYVNYFTENNLKIINVNLGSHLQTEKWFVEDIEYIKNILKIKQNKIDIVKEKYKHFFNKPTIGIGIRRGDFVNHGVFYQIPEKWYLEALEKNFNKENYNTIVFSDDIEWCKKYYKNENFMYAEANNTHLHTDGFKHYHKDPMEQFILASQMENFIGGSSTFSWWNMWYVKNFNNGKVVHSGKNLSKYGEKQFGVNNDYYPDNWVLHEIK